MKKLLYGVGNCDSGVFAASTERCNGRSNDTKLYKLWSGILQRSYSKTLHKRRPTYKNCKVSENFKNFQYFAEWCQNQIGFGKSGFHLDKDILSSGDKLYSEDTCVFVPHQINTVFLTSSGKKSGLPRGVIFDKVSKLFVAKVTVDRVQKYLGHFPDADSAFAAYKVAKEAKIKSLAEEYKDVIDPRVYAALIKYVVQNDVLTNLRDVEDTKGEMI